MSMSIKVRLGVGELLNDKVLIVPEKMTKENCEYVARYCMDNGFAMYLEPNEVIEVLKGIR